MGLRRVAIRIKGKGYRKEEETRVIVQSQLPIATEFVKANRDIIQNALHVDTDALAQAMQQEKERQKGDKTIYYRDLCLPITLLRAVYTRPEYNEQVKDAIQRLVPGEIPVRVINP